MELSCSSDYLADAKVIKLSFLSNSISGILLLDCQRLDMKTAKLFFLANAPQHLTFAAKLKIGVLMQEAGGRMQEGRGRRKEPEEVFLQI